MPTDAVVFSDFRHGIFNRRTIPELIAGAARRLLPGRRQPGREPLGQHHRLQGLRSDHAERARGAFRARRPGLRHSSAGLRRSTTRRTARLLILKLGERGVLACCNADHESLDSFFVIDSFVDRLVDAVGAGDALLAYATLAMLATGSDAIATILGSMAAARASARCDGNIPVTADDVRAKIDVSRAADRPRDERSTDAGRGRRASACRVTSAAGSPAPTSSRRSIRSTREARLPDDAGRSARGL